MSNVDFVCWVFFKIGGNISIQQNPAEMVDKFWIMKKSSGVFVLLFYFPSIIFCTIFIGVFLLLSFKEA